MKKILLLTVAITFVAISYHNKNFVVIAFCYNKFVAIKYFNYY